MPPAPPHNSNTPPASNEGGSAGQRPEDLAAIGIFIDSLLENIPGILYLKDAKTLRYVRFNKAAEEHLGRSRHETIGRSDHELFSPEEADRFIASDCEVLATGKSIETTDHLFSAKHQEFRVIQSKKLAILNHAGQPLYILGISEDITGARQAETERLARAKEQAAREEAEKVAHRLRILSQASALVSSSLDHRTTMKNIVRSIVPALADWCVVEILSPEGEIQDAVMEHVYDNDEIAALYPLSKEEQRAAFHLAKTSPTLISYCTREGIPKFTPNPTKAAALEKLGLMSCICTPLKLRGSTLGALSLLTSRHSGRVYDERDLQFIEELARHAALALDNARLYQTSQNLNRAKDEFLAMLSHELRTPLSVIHGFAEILKDDGAHLTDQERQEYCEIIFRNSENQTRIVSDLLDISALVTGKLGLNPQPILPIHFVLEVVRDMSPSADAKDIQLVCHGEQAPGLVVADPTRFQQIVWNLLSNAVKFTPHGGTVTITLAQQDRTFILEVVDTGVGIDATFLPHVFERFRQEDSTVTRRYGGLGLGLAIVRHLVELHGGQIEVASEGKGRGTTFTVTLPLAPA